MSYPMQCTTSPAPLRHRAWRTLSLMAACLLGLPVAQAGVTIAQIVPLSGPLAGPGMTFSAGAAACIEDTNRKGGVAGKPVKYVKVDDGYDPARSVAALESLLERPDRPSALLVFGTASSLAVSKRAAELKAELPILPTGSGARSLQESEDPNLFHVRAATAVEVDRLIAAHAITGIKSFAVIYQDDALGQDGLAAARATMARLGLPAPPAVGFARGTKDFDTVARQVAGAAAQAVLIVGPGPDIARFIQSARTAQLTARLLAISNLEPSQLVKTVGTDAARGISIAQVFPDLVHPRLPLAREFTRIVGASPDTALLNPYALEGCIQALTVIEAARRTRDGSGPALRQALENSSRLDLGGYFLTFSRGRHAGSSFVNIGVMDRQGQLRF
ncbi:ABC transporter substrate-binding protein [Variovorax terrae]|uniref:ABC transporter substrate-binding protein n=1 Tax=Variovorax terrae TaxID=2923278 RepID=A0A9X2AQA3_9BURK|nr:ABC transporter substrate-binding protein [Variovorax terrae]MCJ0766144.1 ABC transporter substrate-binding protein [Variovorax terrae]